MPIDQEPDDLTRALILKDWPKRPDPESLALMMEGLLLEPYGGAHCVLCGGRINCADCRPSVPTGHTADCKMPEFLEFYLPESAPPKGDVAPDMCYACKEPITEAVYGVGKQGKIHWHCYDKLFPQRYFPKVEAPAEPVAPPLLCPCPEHHTLEGRRHCAEQVAKGNPGYNVVQGEQASPPTPGDFLHALYCVYRGCKRCQELMERYPAKSPAPKKEGQ